MPAPGDIRHTRRWRERIVPRIVRRDRGMCHLCDLPGADTADHVVPFKVSQDNRDVNLRAAHRDCNQIRGDRTIAWARTEIAKRNGTVSVGWDW